MPRSSQTALTALDIVPMTFLLCKLRILRKHRNTFLASWLIKCHVSMAGVGVRGAPVRTVGKGSTMSRYGAFNLFSRFTSTIEDRKKMCVCLASQYSAHVLCTEP